MNDKNTNLDGYSFGGSTFFSTIHIESKFYHFFLDTYIYLYN